MADNLTFNYGITINLARAGAIAGTGFSFTSTAATNCVIAGKFAVPLGVQTNAVLSLIDAATNLPFKPVPANFCCCLVFGQNMAGQLLLCQSNVIPAGPLGTLLNDPQFPGLPNDFCPLAYCIVIAGPTAVGNWTPAANNWAGVTGVVVTPFTNVCQLPTRPQSS